MMELIILSLIVNQCVAIGEAYMDVQSWKEKQTIKHGQSAFFRGIAWVILSAGIHYGEWGMAVILALLLGFQYFLSFNFFFNMFAGHEWYYGGDGPFDSILEGKENRWKQLAMKVGLVSVTAFVYFDLYEHIYVQ